MSSKYLMLALDQRHILDSNVRRGDEVTMWRCRSVKDSWAKATPNRLQASSERIAHGTPDWILATAKTKLILVTCDGMLSTRVKRLDTIGDTGGLYEAVISRKCNPETVSPNVSSARLLRLWTTWQNFDWSSNKVYQYYNIVDKIITHHPCSPKGWSPNTEDSVAERPGNRWNAGGLPMIFPAFWRFWPLLGKGMLVKNGKNGIQCRWTPQWCW